jgi:hypothetical protein
MGTIKQNRSTGRDRKNMGFDLWYYIAIFSDGSERKYYVEKYAWRYAKKHGLKLVALIEGRDNPIGEFFPITYYKVSREKLIESQADLIVYSLRCMLNSRDVFSLGIGCYIASKIKEVGK